MKKIPIYQVDAFTEKLFSGNPAAVCILEEWLDDEMLQNIGTENNLAETAFIVLKNDEIEIRWFTPAVEVDLCGHATLAAAYILFNYMNYNKEVIKFTSPRSGLLTVNKHNDMLVLDFPTDTLCEVDCYDQITQCIGIKPTELYKGKTDTIAVVNSEEELRNLKPNLSDIAQLKGRGLIVTAKGDQCDFVSRFFAPQSGINEDPVTGSAHTSLTPLWSKKLKKETMTAIQLSKRGGKLSCTDKGDRVQIGGSAKLYLSGTINIQ